MKREAWDHPKFKLAARDLQIPLSYMRGIVESIWLATGIHWFRGDIGRWSNEEIAVSIDYPGDADRLVEVLLNRRLLDALPESDGRLYVHDWHEHCDRYTNLKVLKMKTKYANGAPARTKEREETQDTEKEHETPLNTDDSATENVKQPLASQENAKPPLMIQRGISPKPEPEPEPGKDIYIPPTPQSDPWAAYPESLQTEEFHVVWVRWLEHLGKNHHHFPDEIELEEGLSFLASVPDAIDRLKRAMRNGWKCIPESDPPTGSRSVGKRPAAKQTKSAEERFAHLGSAQ